MNLTKKKKKINQQKVYRNKRQGLPPFLPAAFFLLRVQSTPNSITNPSCLFQNLDFKHRIPTSYSLTLMPSTATIFCFGDPTFFLLFFYPTTVTLFMILRIFTSFLKFNLDFTVYHCKHPQLLSFSFLRPMLLVKIKQSKRKRRKKNQRTKKPHYNLTYPNLKPNSLLPLWTNNIARWDPANRIYLEIMTSHPKSPNPCPIVLNYLLCTFLPCSLCNHFFWPCSMWDLSSPNRDGTCAPCVRSMGVLTIGLPGKSPN